MTKPRYIYRAYHRSTLFLGVKPSGALVQLRPGDVCQNSAIFGDARADRAKLRLASRCGLFHVDPAPTK
jgi:hypothetical protein